MQRSLEVLRDDSTPPKSPFVRPHMNFAKSASAKSKLQRRIWALILLLGFVFILTRLFSHSSSQRHPFYDQESLHPRNYLNGSLSASNPPPFSFCPVHGPGDTIGQKYGPSAMAKSRLHLGSGARIQRVIHRVSMRMKYHYIVSYTIFCRQCLVCPSLLVLLEVPVSIDVCFMKRTLFGYPFTFRYMVSCINELARIIPYRKGCHS